MVVRCSICLLWRLQIRVWTWQWCTNLWFLSMVRFQIFCSKVLASQALLPGHQPRFFPLSAYYVFRTADIIIDNMNLVLFAGKAAIQFLVNSWSQIDGICRAYHYCKSKIVEAHNKPFNVRARSPSLHLYNSFSRGGFDFSRNRIS